MQDEGVDVRCYRCSVDVVHVPMPRQYEWNNGCDYLVSSVSTLSEEAQRLVDDFDQPAREFHCSQDESDRRVHHQLARFRAYTAKWSLLKSELRTWKLVDLLKEVTLRGASQEYIDSRLVGDNLDAIKDKVIDILCVNFRDLDTWELSELLQLAKCYGLKYGKGGQLDDALSTDDLKIMKQQIANLIRSRGRGKLHRELKLDSIAKQPDVLNYLKRLLPVHSCSVAALQDILKSGGLQAKSIQPRSRRTVYQQFKDDFEGEFDSVIVELTCNFQAMRASAREGHVENIPEWWGPTSIKSLTANIDVISDGAGIRVVCTELDGSKILDESFLLDAAVSDLISRLNDGVARGAVLGAMTVEGREVQRDSLLRDYATLAFSRSSTTKACRRCVNSILNLAAMRVYEERFGSTGMLRVAQERLQSQLTVWGLKARHFEKINSIAERLSSHIDNDVAAGIGYWGDSFLGTDSNCFAVLGPNAYYGCVSIVFDAETLQSEDTSVIVNSASSFLSGSSFELRPWAISQQLSEAPFLGQKNVKHVNNHINEAAWKADLVCKRYEMERSRFRYTDLALELLSAEIAAAANFSLRGLDTGDLVWHMYYDGHAVFKPCGRIAASVQELYLSVQEAIEAADILSWYEKVDPHGKIEVLLPKTVPLDQIAAVVVTKDVDQVTLDSLIEKVGKAKVFVVKDIEESLRLQRESFRSGHWARASTNVMGYATEPTSR